MIRVILESPYRGTTEEETQANIEYARQCLRDSLLRGEAPIASHLLYTQPGVLDDTKSEERQHGIDAGLIWGSAAERTVVYIDRGISHGMNYGILRADQEQRQVIFRSLYRNQEWFGKGESIDGYSDWSTQFSSEAGTPEAGRRMDNLRVV